MSFTLEEWICPHCGCLNYNLQMCVRCKADKISADALQHKITSQIAEIRHLKSEIGNKIPNILTTINSAKNDVNTYESEYQQLQQEYIQLLDAERELMFQTIYRQPTKIIVKEQKQLEI